MTYSELKQFVEKKNVRYELNPKKEKYDSLEVVDGKLRYVEKERITGYFFGMNNIAGRSGQSEWQWVWYECHCTEEPKDDEYMFFVERFSMVNGKSYTGWSEEYKAMCTIERRMNN